jgi:'Cold-shock' DNA-binding domain
VGGVDIFLHVSQLIEGIEDTLQPGTRVAFEEVPSRRKGGTFEAAKGAGDLSFSPRSAFSMTSSRASSGVLGAASK